MTTKVTLNLNSLTIEKAKNYAKSNDTSLSKLIENYLKSLANEAKNEQKISPLVESLTGILPTQKTNDYVDYLSKKYS